MELNTGHLLAGGRYRIERVLGQGGFGITYLAEQTGLARKVAIKEFFMKELCNREGDTSHVTVPSMGSREMVDRFREKFIKEARAIARLSHKHIVRIIDVFEENNTAYYVMEYVGGGSLGEKSKGCALPEDDAVRYIRQLASALDYVHSQRMMHLDVKPGNVLLNSDDEAVLIDFGLSKQYDMSGEQTSSTPVGISHGYAPLEQYKRGGVGTFSPATDIYSLGATLYRLLTGETPPEAGDVNDEGLPALPGNVSAPVRKAVEAAMQPRRKDRPQSIDEFIALLDGSSAGVISNVSEKSQTQDDDGETVVSFDNKNSSTLGGEVSRSDGREKSQSADRVIPTKRSAEESQSAKEEILHSAQDDKGAKKEEPADRVISNVSEKSQFGSNLFGRLKFPGKSFFKKLFIIATIVIIVFMAIVYRVVPEFRYDDAWSAGYGLTSVEKGGKWGCVDWIGNEVIECKYDNVLDFRDGLAEVELNGKWGIIDKSGNEVIECKYDGIDMFSGFFAEVKLDGKCFYIDENGLPSNKERMVLIAGVSVVVLVPLWLLLRRRKKSRGGRKNL